MVKFVEIKRSGINSNNPRLEKISSSEAAVGGLNRDGGGGGSEGEHDVVGGEGRDGPLAKHPHFSYRCHLFPLR